MAPQNSVLSLSLALALTISVSACGPEDSWDVNSQTAAQFSAQQLFDQFKAIEAQFPLPQGTSTVVVGTLNPDTGAWNGLETTTQVVINPITHKPYVVTIPAHATIAGVNAALQFTCLNRGTRSFYVQIDGKTKFAPYGVSTFSVDVDRDPSVAFTVSCGGKLFSDVLKISRPNAYGTGAFEIPAFPFALLYEPPTNQAETNYAAYSTSTQESATVTMSRTETKSETRPVFSGLSTITSRLGEVKQFLEKGSGPSQVIAGINLATQLVGTAKTEVLDATTTQTEHTLEYSTTSTNGMKTTADLGPGLGDIAGYLKRARFVWTMVEGQVEITLIDFDVEAYSHMVDILDDYNYLAGKPDSWTGPVTGLRRDSLEMLLKLDPFRLGEWDTARFEFKKTIQPAGDITVGLTHTYKESDKQVETHTKSTVTEAHAGWLSVIGLGVPESGKFKTTVTQSQSRKSTVGSTVTASFLLSAQPGESYKVDCYFDKVFGTFAFKKVKFLPPSLPPSLPVLPKKLTLKTL
jgi:hypothetical protein